MRVRSRLRVAGRRDGRLRRARSAGDCTRVNRCEAQLVGSGRLCRAQRSTRFAGSQGAGRTLRQVARSVLVTRLAGTARFASLTTGAGDRTRTLSHGNGAPVAGKPPHRTRSNYARASRSPGLRFSASRPVYVYSSHAPGSKPTWRSRPFTPREAEDRTLALPPFLWPNPTAGHESGATAAPTSSSRPSLSRFEGARKQREGPALRSQTTEARMPAGGNYP